MSHADHTLRRPRSTWQKTLDEVGCKQTLLSMAHLPLKEVATLFKVNETYMKKICRVFDIPRWPYRGSSRRSISAPKLMAIRKPTQPSFSTADATRRDPKFSEGASYGDATAASEAAQLQLNPCSTTVEESVTIGKNDATQKIAFSVTWMQGMSNDKSWVRANNRRIKICLKVRQTYV